MLVPEPLLNDWRSFYGLVGSAAAALTGLTFVVIALAEKPLPTSGVNAYMTPTVIHFGSALALAAVLSMPGHSAASLAACLCGGGVAGVIYSFTTTARMFRGRANYAPARSDWIWNALLPCLCYLSMLDSAALIVMRPPLGLYVTAATALGLLFIGIHNVWDMAVWLITRRDPNRPNRPRDPD
jgi:positive regulator of sigma E activity